MGITGQASITLQEVIQGALANQADIAVAHVAKDESMEDVKSSLGVYDPVLGINAYRERQVVPVSSILRGSTTGELTTKTFSADPQISGLTPWLGGSYKLLAAG